MLGESGQGMIGRRLKLDHKAEPSVEANLQPDVPLWVRYGCVQGHARAIGARLAAEGEKVWSEEGQRGNVRLRRAFHDRLGVHQVMFVFCDDLLTRVYEFPWYAGWGKCLSDLWATLGLSEHQIVRCLLAKLEPGSVIPVHHDTGLWTLKTHRVHVPVITSEQTGDPAKQVVFKVGRSESSLERVPFEYGQAIELNNRAKHFVENNWGESRVHLIFDYVEKDVADSLPRTKLSPGQTVFQSRRTLFLDKPDFLPADIFNKLEQPPTPPGGEVNGLTPEERKSRAGAALEVVKKANVVQRGEFPKASRRYADGEMHAMEYLRFCCRATGSRERLVELFEEIDLPSLIHDEERSLALRHRYRLFMSGPRPYLLIGAMKCGTTSLYDYLAQHPHIARSKQKEPHFFDWKWDEVLKWKPQLPLKEQAALLCRHHSVQASLDDGAVAIRHKFMHLFDIGQLLVDPGLQCVGEASPSYLLGGSTVARRVKHVLGGDVKLLVILRDPVKRAYSQYQMITDPSGTEDQKRRRGNHCGKSFPELVAQDMAALKALGADDPATVDMQRLQEDYFDKRPVKHGAHSYVGRGMYALQLRAWLEVFQRENFYVLRLEDLARDTPAEMHKVHAFLDLSQDYPLQDPTPKNARSYDPIDPELQSQLQDFYRPHNQALVELLGDRFSY